jgi:VWFA-related protein
MRAFAKTACFLGLALLGLAVSGQGKDEDKKNQEKQPADFHYETAVERVEVDVLVLDKDGQFVTGLTQDDFEIYEEGKQVQIVDFEERVLASASPALRPAAAPAPQPAASAARPAVASAPASLPPLGRKFILFADLLNLGLGALQNARPYLHQFVNDTLGPADEMMIAILTPDRRLLVLQSFTNDRGRLNRAIEVLKGNPNMDTREPSAERDVYSTLYGGFSGESGLENTAEMSLDRIFVAIQNAATLVDNHCFEEYLRTSYALDSLASVAERIEQSGWQTGRKSLIYLSEGLPLRPGQPLIDVINRRIDEYNRMLEVNSGATQPNSGRAFPVKVKYDLQSLVDTTVGRLNRFGATLYTIDARGTFQLAASDAGRPRSNLSPGQQQAAFFDSQQTLSALAADTGGVAFFNRTNLSDAFSEIERDNHRRYFLTYEPPRHKRGKKAKFYSIEVKCKTPGVKLRARKGYLD